MKHINFKEENNIKSKIILKYINAPEQINSIEHVNQLLEDSSCFTLIEKPFFLNIINIVNDICSNNVPGDIVIVGVFKGGSALYIKALFDELGYTRKIWLFDSFKGFNITNIKHEKDLNSLALFSSDKEFEWEKLASPKSVEHLFQKFDMNKNIEIVDGYIEESLKSVIIESIAFLHIDVDCYEPTLYTLENLYPKITLGGWCVLDDYYVSIFGCSDATDHYRSKNNIESPIVKFGKYPAGWKIIKNNYD